MRSINRYFYGLVLAVLLIVLIAVFSSKSGSNPVANDLPSNYAEKNSYVELYVRGPITSDQTHNDASITVSANSVTMNNYVGYNGKISDSRTYSNTQNSYFNFLKALDLQSFMASDQKNIGSSPIGRCSFGNVYEFQLYNDGNKVQDLWSSNCNGVPGDYKGNISNTLDLFKSQVPDFDTLSQELNFNFY